MIPSASYRCICRTLEVSRSILTQYVPRARSTRQDDRALEARMHELIQLYPTFGYRRIWSLLYFREGILVNKKKIYRIFRKNRWFVIHRTVTPKPRVKVKKSTCEKSNTRWAMDLTHIYCGKDGWGHLAAVIDIATTVN